ncbi:MAG: SDR family NAD(P)-dependent oxidoreductase [Myxococcota bacterium]|nr:SDR family NAD(P)-dependent oxidoreductase [Myxococcota bacterium]
MRLEGRVGILVGAGQTPGETIGNGRATALAMCREGARLLLVDREPDSLEETRGLIRDEGFDAETLVADAVDEDACREMVEQATRRLGRVDLLHYNVGIGRGDRELSTLRIEDWDLIFDVNLRGFYLATKYALPVMREQQSGVILGVSSVAAIASTPLMAYKASKAGMNALVQSLAVLEGRNGIRANAILPGLMDTPMAIEPQAKARGMDREEVRAQRHRAVPLGRKMGTAWDIANAAVFLASDEARYISGVSLPVDGALSARVGG